MAPHASHALHIDPEAVEAELADASPEEAIAWAIEHFHPSLSLACSFQKTTSVTIDIAQPCRPRRALLLPRHRRALRRDLRDARRARGALRDRVRALAGISLDEQARLYGDALWARQPDACCGIRKVEPMREALSGDSTAGSPASAAPDSETRAGAAKFGWDIRFGLWKLNPLADWTEQDVWNYINEHEVPYNPLHDAGYPSIGCTHCTRPPAANGAPLRALGERRQDRVRAERVAEARPLALPFRASPVRNHSRESTTLEPPCLRPTPP